MSLTLALMISVAMKAARSAPRSEPAKSHAFPAESEAAQRPFGGVVGEANSVVIEEGRESLEHDRARISAQIL